MTLNILFETMVDLKATHNDMKFNNHYAVLSDNWLFVFKNRYQSKEILSIHFFNCTTLRNYLQSHQCLFIPLNKVFIQNIPNNKIYYENENIIDTQSENANNKACNWHQNEYNFLLNCNNRSWIFTLDSLKLRNQWLKLLKNCNQKQQINQFSFLSILSKSLLIVINRDEHVCIFYQSNFYILVSIIVFFVCSCAHIRN